MPDFRVPRTAKEREVSEISSKQYEPMLADVMLAIDSDSCSLDCGGTQGGSTGIGVDFLRHTPALERYIRKY